MTETREFICVTCPTGCAIQAVIEDGRPVSMTGQACRRGEDYVRTELSDPRRMLSTTVQVTGGLLPLLPIHTSAPIPKPLLLAAAAEMRRVVVPAPIAEGQVIVRDILGTGVDMLASRPIAAGSG